MTRKDGDTAATGRFATRRTVLKTLAGLGVGTAAFQRALAAQVEAAGVVTADMIGQAAWIAGLQLSDDQRDATARVVTRALRSFAELRAVSIEYHVPPALMFCAKPTERADGQLASRFVSCIEDSAPVRPTSNEDLAFLPVTKLAALIRHGQLTSSELTQLYLQRLRQYDKALLCVATLTEDVAIQQAEQADREIAAGRYRGVLHGIPWGAKDLIAYPGYPTGWGATPFRNQRFNEKATVAKRLEEAGAVLVAKLSLGALAQGDRWYRGMTRNPWNPAEGSSGSSAGSASATAAGLVAFAIGSETLGSIVSPCRRCGTSGLRPTFGRVSRYGCMSLAWSMDKIGPIARSVEDCALVFAAIHGFDGLDPTALDRPFHWPPTTKIGKLRVGFLKTSEPTESRREIQVLQHLGVELVPISLPDKYPIEALRIILTAEAATVFDPLTRDGVTEGIGNWPNSFRQGEFIPAVEYLRANRIRTLLMREMEDMMSEIDAYVDGDDLTLTNLTGYPTVVLPNGFRRTGDGEVPYAITFTGRLFDESNLLALAHAYQQTADYHLRQPKMEMLTPESE